MIKRLAVFDFDGTLINSPDPETGKVQWSEKMGKPFPFSGWWGRPESLDLKVFDIKPFPSVLLQLKKESVTPDTYVIVLTSRMEKLRPEVQAVLDANHIVVDKLDMKRAEGDKGVKVMRYVQQIPDLKRVNVYEDRDIDIEAYERIRSQMPEGVEFNIYLANQGKLALTEVSRGQNLIEIIKEEIQDFNEEFQMLDTPIDIYHGGSTEGYNILIKTKKILSPEEKEKMPSNTGGYLVGMSTSTDIDKARKYAMSLGNDKVLQMQLLPNAKVIQVDTEGQGIDGVFTGDQLENFQKQGIDAIIETDDYAENEVRILNSNHLKMVGLV